MVDRDTILGIAKRRGFFIPTASNHGGCSGFYTLGTYGSEMHKNIIKSWRETFVNRHGFEEVHSPNILPESVFEASGHLDGFDDAMIGCSECDSFHRADKLVEQDNIVNEAEGLSMSILEDYIIDSSVSCPTCLEDFVSPTVKSFNLMFETDIGPANGSKGYLRPETAQGTLSDFCIFKEQVRQDYPVGLAQVGRAYRNEISPRKSLIRTREFSQAELQTFIIDSSPPSDIPESEVTFVNNKNDEKSKHPQDYEGVESPWILYYIGLTNEWLISLGVEEDSIRFRQHQEDELAHYADECWDAEIRIHGEWTEVAGIANRSSHDLKSHAEYTGADYTEFVEFDEPLDKTDIEVNVDMRVIGPKFGSNAQSVRDSLVDLLSENPELVDNEEVVVEVDSEKYEVETSSVSVERVNRTIQGERRYPEVVEPAFGIERILYAVLEQTYRSDEVEDEEREYFSIPASVAPNDLLVTVSIAKDDITEYAEDVVREFRQKDFKVEYEYTGSVGKRYRRSDEIGTPYTVTIDHETLENDTVTIRERDSMEQIRVPVSQSYNVVDRLCEDEKFEVFKESFQNV